MKNYKALNKHVYSEGIYSIVPIRFEDRMDIMKWRNEQIYHLRQSRPLTIQDQDNYFNTIISQLFESEKPNQLLFSYLENDKCIGYGGLVHINWIDKNAEISFVMNTELERDLFKFHWCTYLKLLENIAFNELNFHKIFTYAFDLRPQLYEVLEFEDYQKEAVLKEHSFIGNKYIDVIVHSKINNQLILRQATKNDIYITFDWASNKLVRKHSIQKGKIGFEEHKNWFLNKLNSNACVYFIAELENHPIGSIRFDVDEDKIATISYLVDPNYHGKGYGKEILNIACKQVLNLKYLNYMRGIVDVKNIPSIVTFEKLGFNELSNTGSLITFEKKYY
jgi:RimJ/RimL family protein N-acetyltransferase